MLLYCYVSFNLQLISLLLIVLLSLIPVRDSINFISCKMRLYSLLLTTTTSMDDSRCFHTASTLFISSRYLHRFLFTTSTNSGHRNITDDVFTYFRLFCFLYFYDIVFLGHPSLPGFVFLWDPINLLVTWKSMSKREGWDVHSRSSSTEYRNVQRVAIRVWDVALFPTLSSECILTHGR